MFMVELLSCLTSFYQLYQVVGESTVRAYKSELADEMEAQTYELMERAREGLKQVQKEENDLRFGVPPFPSLRSSKRQRVLTNAVLR